MMHLSSTGALVSALRGARDVDFSSYTLARGRVLGALCAAARSGAHVRVRLEGDIYKDGGGAGAVNAAAIAALRSAGADASVVHASDDATDAMLHAKVAIVDGTLFLDDCNWGDEGKDTVVRSDAHEDGAPVTWTKRASLAAEAQLLDAAQRGDDVILESESFGTGNRVCGSLDRIARAGAHVRVLVNARDLRGNPSERRALQKLQTLGAEVRITGSSEKFAVLNGTHAWLGSANATAAFSHPDQIDWGARTDAPGVVTHLRQAFERRWAGATVLRAAP
jgi:phosphatidylserine/phosphatidylglycerophosphate/cardiolipin synthase-like enzyme